MGELIQRVKSGIMVGIATASAIGIKGLQSYHNADRDIDLGKLAATAGAAGAALGLFWSVCPNSCNRSEEEQEEDFLMLAELALPPISVFFDIAYRDLGGHRGKRAEQSEPSETEPDERGYIYDTSCTIPVIKNYVPPEYRERNEPRHGVAQPHPTWRRDEDMPFQPKARTEQPAKTTATSYGSIKKEEPIKKAPVPLFMPGDTRFAAPIRTAADDEAEEDDIARMLLGFDDDDFDSPPRRVPPKKEPLPPAFRDHGYRDTFDEDDDYDLTGIFEF